MEAAKAKSIKIVSKLGADCLKGISRKDYKKSISEEASKSCRALNVNKLDGYLLHDPQYLYEPETLAALNELKKEGHIENIGVSVYSQEDAMFAAHSSLIDYIQVPYNALDNRLDRNGFFELAQINKKTIFARSVFLQGLLLMTPEAVPRHIESARDSIRRFRGICDEAGYDYVNGSLAYIKANNAIDYLVFGANDVGQLAEIVAGYNSIDKVAESFIIRIVDRMIFRETPHFHFCFLQNGKPKSS